MTLFDHDYAFSDDFLGYARITLSTLPLGRLTPLTLPLSARTEGEEVAGTVTVKVVVEQIPAGTFPAWSNNFIAAKYAPSNMGGTMISAMENEEEYDGEDGDGGSSVYDGADEEDESMDEQQPEVRHRARSPKTASRSALTRRRLCRSGRHGSRCGGSKHCATAKAMRGRWTANRRLRPLRRCTKARFTMSTATTSAPHTFMSSSRAMFVARPCSASESRATSASVRSLASAL